uniref:Uncharacterized protein n=1 Tax=Anguilla anguilla TaxID=7936 RepID=A0A0E9XIU7_ANGAN
MAVSQRSHLSQTAAEACVLPVLLFLF